MGNDFMGEPTFPVSAKPVFELAVGTPSYDWDFTFHSLHPHSTEYPEQQDHFGEAQEVIILSK